MSLWSETTYDRRLAITKVFPLGDQRSSFIRAFPLSIVFTSLTLPDFVSSNSGIVIFPALSVAI